MRSNGASGLSLYEPCNSMRLKCQLRALHGNEAQSVVLSYPNPSAGYKTPSCASTACEVTISYASPQMEHFAIVLNLTNIIQVDQLPALQETVASPHFGTLMISYWLSFAMPQP